MNKKKKIIYLLISLLAAMAFAACSKTEEPETPITEEEVVEETQVKEDSLDTSLKGKKFVCKETNQLMGFDKNEMVYRLCFVYNTDHVDATHPYFSLGNPYPYEIEGDSVFLANMFEPSERTKYLIEEEGSKLILTRESDGIKFVEVSVPTIEYKVDSDYVLVEDCVVREGASETSRQKTYDELSDDGKRHAREGENAVLKSGTEVTCLEVKDNWMRIPSGWICCRDNSTLYVKESAKYHVVYQKTFPELNSSALNGKTYNLSWPSENDQSIVGTTISFNGNMCVFEILAENGKMVETEQKYGYENGELCIKIAPMSVAVFTEDGNTFVFKEGISGRLEKE